MNKGRILLIIQLCIGLILGISLIMQVEYSKNKAYEKSTSILGAFNQIQIKEFEPNDVFANVDPQIRSMIGNEQEMLAKSKKEKIMVTKY